jgi:hypothetical protein
MKKPREILCLLVAAALAFAGCPLGGGGGGDDNDGDDYTLQISSNANLRLLAVSPGGTLAPAFDPGKTAYRVTVDSPSVIVTAFADDGGAQIAYAPPGGVLSLAPDTTQTMRITVTAQDGVTTKDYSVTVTRPPSGGGVSSNASLASLGIDSCALVPGFDANVLDYEAAADTSVGDTITITAVTANGNAAAVVYDPSSTPTSTITLATEGKHIITVTVTAENLTQKTYTIEVTRTLGKISAVAHLARIGTAGYPLNGKYTLEADNIELTEWMPIGSETNPFTGTFDGKDKTLILKGFAAGALGGNLGVFGYARGAEIHDLKVNLAWTESMFTLSGTGIQYVGGAVGRAGYEASLSNISVSGSGIKVSKAQGGNLFVGGIAGRCHQRAEISECTSAVNIEAAAASGQVFAGGIAGDNHTGALITECSAAGSVKARTTGAASSGNDCRADAGGIAGRNRGSVISKSWASGTIEAGAYGSGSSAMAGGIAGQNIIYIDTADQAVDPATITDCYSTGTVTVTEGTAYAGGIVGQNISNQASKPATIRRCYSTGNISSSGSGNIVRAAGIVAENTSNSDPTGGIGKVVVEYCYALGDISASGSSPSVAAGGLTGWNYGDGADGINADIKVRYSAALNKQTNSSSHEVVRIGRVTDQAILTGKIAFTGNIAYDNMLLNGYPSYSSNPNGVHGESKTSTELTTQSSTWTALFESGGANFSSYWKWIGGYDYPVLIWQDAAPAGAPTLP